MAQEKRLLTKSEIERLDAELQNLIQVERPAYKKELAEARAEGDLSENADYDAARNKQAQIEARISELQAILSNAEVIATKSTRGAKKFSIGSTVKFERKDTGAIKEYTLADSSVSDPSAGTISPKCALGEAIMGKMVGDVVSVKANNPYNIEILEVSFKN